MKKCFQATVVITFVLSVLMLPTPGLAVQGATAYGEASIGYNSLTFSRTDLNWFDMTFVLPLDTRGSNAGVSVTMGGVTDPYHSNFIDVAPWGNVSMLPPESAHNFSTPANTVVGSAYTNVTNTLQPALFSNANVALTNSSFPVPAGQTPVQEPVSGIGSVDLAQALFGGQFTVLTNGLLTITASYSLLYNLGLLPFVGSNAFANAYVDAGLALYDLNGFDSATQQSPLLASDVRFLSGAINLPGSASGSDSDVINPLGPLTLTYSLLALDPRDPKGLTPMIYDFEASVKAQSSAKVPEPMSVLLLLSGLAGLAIFKKRFV